MQDTLEEMEANQDDWNSCDMF